MGVEKLRTVTDIADLCATRTVNQLYSAMNRTFAPRNSSGVVTTIAGAAGTTSYRWLHGYFKTMYIGKLTEGNKLTSDGENIQAVLNDLNVLEISSDRKQTSSDGTDPGALGFVKSASSGSFSTSSGSFVDVTNLEVNLTGFYGRPILVGLMHDETANQGDVSWTYSGSGALVHGQIFIEETTEVPTLGVCKYEMLLSQGDIPTGRVLHIPATSIWGLLLGNLPDTAGAPTGVNTLKCKVSSGSTDNTVAVNNCVLFAREI